MNPLRPIAAALLIAAGPQAEAPLTPPRVARCLEERFSDADGAFYRAGIRPGSAPSFVAADDDCLVKDFAGCARTPLDGNHAWFAGPRVGLYICVTDGERFGWTRSSDLELLPVTALPMESWLGSWTSTTEHAALRISRARDPGSLRVEGDASWQGRPDSDPHTGDLDRSAVPVGNELRLGEPKCLDALYKEDHDECTGCVARLMLINGRIFMNDNRGCGGMNVNFDGLYSRTSTQSGPKR